MEYYYIVAAAGVGKRMGLDYPKQFLEIEGKPIFIKTLEVIENNSKVKGIIVVTNDEYIKEVEKLCKKFNISKVLEIIKGGSERQFSIYNALLKLPKESIIGVQDGVRPFIKDSYITKAYEELVSKTDLDGIVVGVPVKDTIKKVSIDNKQIKETPKRETLFAAQTPQVFKGKILIESYEDAIKSNFLGTDDSSIVERKKGKVKMIMGSYGNIKITTPEDLLFLEK